jgi:hypothetical protein
MITKMFEIRDDGTLMPVIAIKFEPADDRERAVLYRGGYGGTADEQGRYIYLINLNNEEGSTDPYEHRRGRTRLEAHRYIKQHFDELPPGALIDIEYILGERATPKQTELRLPA